MSSGGSTVSTTVSGGSTNFGNETIYAGGTATATLVAASGTETVLSGATATATVVASGGFMQLGQAPFNGQPGSAGGTPSAPSFPAAPKP